MSRRILDGRDPQAMAAALFCAFTLAGCGYVVASKSLGLGTWAATLVPALLILGYGCAALFAAGGRLRDAHTGDNVYYMGFLFTLASLGTALHQFGTGGGGAEAVVRDFGVALSSTVAGVAGRVVIAQLRHEPAEVERTARLELADAARRFRRELDAAIVEAGAHRRAAAQAHREALDEIEGVAAAAARARLAGIEAAAAGAERAIEEATARLCAAMEAKVPATPATHVREAAE